MKEPRQNATTRGFARAASLVQRDVRAASESRGFAETRLLTHWPEVAGAAIAAIARPVEVSFAREGFGATLTLLTTGAQAPMLEMQKEAIRERVNACYGYNAISRIRITQTAPNGFAEGQVAFTPAPKAEPAPDAAAARSAEALATGVHDPELRLALAALGANVLTKSKS